MKLKQISTDHIIDNFNCLLFFLQIIHSNFLNINFDYLGRFSVEKNQNIHINLLNFEDENANIRSPSISILDFRAIRELIPQKCCNSVVALFGIEFLDFTSLEKFFNCINLLLIENGLLLFSINDINRLLLKDEIKREMKSEKYNDIFDWVKWFCQKNQIKIINSFSNSLYMKEQVLFLGFKSTDKNIKSYELINFLLQKNNFYFLLILKIYMINQLIIKSIKKKIVKFIFQMMDLRLLRLFIKRVINLIPGMKTHVTKVAAANYVKFKAEASLLNLPKSIFSQIKYIIFLKSIKNESGY